MTSLTIEYQKYLRAWKESSYHDNDGYTEKEYGDHRKTTTEEYQKYLKVKYDTNCRTRGEDVTLTLEDYTIHLAIMKTFIGRLISKDPNNFRSDIGNRIFKHLCHDFGSAITFSTASKGLHERAVKNWFVDNSREFTLLSIQRDVRFKDFMKEEGWKDALLSSVELAGVAATIASFVGASIYSRRIPADAPRKTRVEYGEFGDEYQTTWIDHPAASARNGFATLGVFSGIGTGMLMTGRRLHEWFELLPLESFFSVPGREAEKDLLFDPKHKPNAVARAVFPKYRKWKLEKMKENLLSNPEGWEEDPELSKRICPLSDSFMLYPVKDKCGHKFDYRSLRASQLQPSNATPCACPISGRADGWLDVKFDKAGFDDIQRILWGKAHPPPTDELSEEASENKDLSFESSEDESYLEETTSPPPASILSGGKEEESGGEYQTLVENAKLDALFHHDDQDGIRKTLSQIDSGLLAEYNTLFQEYMPKHNEFEKAMSQVEQSYSDGIERSVTPLRESIDLLEKKRWECYREQIVTAAAKTDPEAARQDNEFARGELDREAQEIGQIQKKELEPQLNRLKEEKEIARSKLENDFYRYIPKSNCFLA